MLAVVSRVKWARVEVGAETVGEIGPGLLAFVGVEKGDGSEQVAWLARKLTGLRIFPDESGKMNRSVVEIGGSLLLVPNFTLAGNTDQGMRPGFSGAEVPGVAAARMGKLASACRQGVRVSEGRFGADMQVFSCGDGPVNLVLRPSFRAGQAPAF